MDSLRFEQLCLQEHPVDGGIGTLGEKTLHRVLKLYFEPSCALREQPFGGFIVDILHPDEIIEIQTRSYFPLSRKLEALLPLRPVRVVCPLAAAKWISWIDPATGALSARRRSPKKGDYFDAFYELVHLAPLLGHPGLTLHFLLIDVEEYRLREAVRKRGAQGFVRKELLPIALVDEKIAVCPEDYAALLPASLQYPFTAADLKQLTGRSETLCRRAIYTLTRAGALRRAGKRGRAILYERIPAGPCAESTDMIPLN